MSKSSRHHFIPKFYLNKFTNADNYFFVFDKKNPGKIFRRSPKQVCYENHRNSFFGKANVPIPYLEEHTYSKFDSIHASVFKNLCYNDVDSEYWSTKNVLTIEYFIPFFFWRIPANDIIFEKFIKKSNKLDDLNLAVYDKISNIKIEDPEFHKEVLSNSDFKKVARLHSSMETFKQKIERFKELEWRVYDYSGFGNFLTSDNPLLFKYPFNELSDLRGDLIFPISSTRSFLRIDENRKNLFPQPVLQNFLIIERAQRYVISQNREYLELVLIDYNRLLRNGSLNGLLKSMWEF